MADNHNHDHDRDDGHECNICGQSFDSEEDLQQHAEAEHEDEM
ncbi:hypothetical protein [Halomontanus rarus]|nr:hypothetical protein [Halovivax sp. TS33]